MIEAGQIYRHYKGGRYEIISLGQHSETSEYLVVYRSMDDGKVWVRPHHMFTEVLSISENIEMPRFELVNEPVVPTVEMGYEAYRYKEVVKAKIFEASDMRDSFVGKPGEEYIVQFTEPAGHKYLEVIPKEIFEDLYEKVMPF